MGVGQGSHQPPVESPALDAGVKGIVRLAPAGNGAAARRTACYRPGDCISRARAQTTAWCYALPMNAGVPLLRLEQIAKHFGAIEALGGVSFDVDRGEVVALLGDNGAGKSTLVKIIAGGMPATSGRILFDGVERNFASPSEAKAAGIETVYQDLSLCTNVDVVANFFMGREPTRRVLGI